MGANRVYAEYGNPFSGRKKEKLKRFLQLRDLEYDEEIEYTVNLEEEDGRLAATGSVRGNVFECICVDESYRGQGLSARIITELMNYAFQKGRQHLFLFTKPENESVFSELGFYPVIKTDRILFMENLKDGIGNYARSLSRPKNFKGRAGAVVANCNPFTYGHRYLIEQAASMCDVLHLFILSEDRSLFPAETRYNLAREGIRGIDNVILHRTSDYLLSYAVFPDYFIKEKQNADRMNCELDLRIFAEYFARELKISCRFVGTEPFSAVTRKYNEMMRNILEEYDIEVTEIPRKKQGGTEISASLVRRYLKAEEYGKIKDLVPPSTMKYLLSEEGDAIRKKMEDRD